MAGAGDTLNDFQHLLLCIFTIALPLAHLVLYLKIACFRLSLSGLPFSTSRLVVPTLYTYVELYTRACAIHNLVALDCAPGDSFRQFKPSLYPDFAASNPHSFLLASLPGPVPPDLFPVLFAPLECGLPFLQHPSQSFMRLLVPLHQFHRTPIIPHLLPRPLDLTF